MKTIDSGKKLLRESQQPTSFWTPHAEPDAHGTALFDVGRIDEFVTERKAVVRGQRLTQRRCFSEILYMVYQEAS